LMLTRVYVFNNQLYSDEQEIAINRPAVEPEIVVEQYRKKLSPASNLAFPFRLYR